MPHKFFSSLFGGGGDKKTVPPVPQRFSTRTPAFNISSVTDPTTGAVRSQFERVGSPAQVAQAQRFPRVLADLDKLRGMVTPGFSKIRESRLSQIEAGRSRAIGTLRENLARRRVLGSSFGESALAGTEAEFAERKAAEEGRSFMEEMAATQAVVEQELNVVGAELNREFAELGLAANMSASVNQLITGNARVAMALAAQEQGGFGELFGTSLGFLGGGLFGPVLGRAGRVLGETIFGPEKAPA